MAYEATERVRIGDHARQKEKCASVPRERVNAERNRDSLAKVGAWCCTIESVRGITQGLVVVLHCRPWAWWMWTELDGTGGAGKG